MQALKDLPKFIRPSGTCSGYCIREKTLANHQPEDLFKVS
jgi:hypothetical protein